MENNEQKESAIRIDHVNPEVVEKSSSKVDKKGSSKFSWKKVIILVVTAAGAVVGVWKGIPYITGNYVVPEIPYSVADTISTNSNSTFLDEVLAQHKSKDGESSLLEEVKQLEVYLDMSCKLADLNLSSYTDTIIEIEETETFNKDLEEKYKEFLELSGSVDKEVLSDEALRMYTLAAELNGYKLVVDSKITADGYDILAQYGILVAKTAVLDASGISYVNIENLSIPAKSEDYVIEYKDPVTGKIFTVEIPKNSIIHEVMENVYSAQTKDIENLTADQIIADLAKYLNDTKVATFMHYFNDGRLKTLNNYNDVRAIIEESQSGKAK